MWIARPTGDPVRDTAHIQAAIDSNVEVVRFQAGDYAVNTLRYRSNLRLVGQQTRLRKAAGGGLIFRPYDVSVPTENVTFDSLHIDGGRDAGSDAQWHGIGIYYGRNISVRRCVIENCGGDGLYAGRSAPLDGVAIGGDNDGVLIEQTTLRGNGRAGMSITRGLNVALYRVRFLYNNAGASDSPDVPTLFNSASLTIEPNDGALVSEVRVDRCAFYVHKFRAIALAGSPSISDVRIGSSQFYMSGMALEAIYSSTAARDVSIVGNKIRQNAQRGGITLSMGCEDVDISRNELSGFNRPYVWAIALTKGVREARVQFNTVRQFHSGIQSNGDVAHGGSRNQNVTIAHNTVIGAVEAYKVADTDGAVQQVNATG